MSKIQTEETVPQMKKVDENQQMEEAKKEAERKEAKASKNPKAKKDFSMFIKGEGIVKFKKGQTLTDKQLAILKKNKAKLTEFK